MACGVHLSPYGGIVFRHMEASVEGSSHSVIFFNLYAQEVAKADLSDVVGDVLIVEEVGAHDVRPARYLSRVGLGCQSARNRKFLTGGRTYHLHSSKRRMNACRIFPSHWAGPTLAIR